MTGEPAQFIKGKTIQEQMMQILKMLRDQADAIQEQIDDLQRQIDDIGLQSITPIIDGTYAAGRAVADNSGNDIESTYAPLTSLTDGSVTKVGNANVGTDTKPIKLVAGVPTAVTNDLVDVSSAQTITNVKTFTHSAEAVILKSDSAYSSGQKCSPYLDFKTDSGDVPVGRVYARRDSANNGNFVVDVREPTSGDWKGAVTLACDSSDAYMMGPFRPYNSANVNDFETIGSVAANPNLMHTTGNETINGNKTFKNDIVMEQLYNPYLIMQTNNIPSRSALSSVATSNHTRWEWRAANGDMLGVIQFIHNGGTNSTAIQVCTINNGAEDWRNL